MMAGTIPYYSSFSNARKIGSRQATIFFIAFEKLPKATVNSNKARASLMEIPEVVSVRKPLTRQRTLTLENDEVGGFFVVGMAGGGTASAGGVYCLLLTTTPPTPPPSFPQDAGIQSPRMADHCLPCTPLKTLDSRLKDSACVKTLRTSKRWENIPQNRIKTGEKWAIYPFLCGFLLCRWENFSCAALFLEFLHRLLKDCGNGVVGTQRQLAGDSRGRKCPVSRRLKEKARRQRTLTLENDEVGEFFVVGTTSTTNTVTKK